ncbi:MAG: hypothetical protein WCI43_01290, partial [Candidatus Firestonebacteria bacterium]
PSPVLCFKGVSDYEPGRENQEYGEWPLTPEMLDKWIKTEPSAYCGNNKNFRWFRIIEKPREEVMVVKRDNFGYIKEIKAGGKLITGDRVRGVFPGLRSNLIKIEGGFLYGAGWGHGVGMCQGGAVGMARKGFNYKDIIGRYFSSSEVRKSY